MNVPTRHGELFASEFGLLFISMARCSRVWVTHAKCRSACATSIDNWSKRTVELKQGVRLSMQIKSNRVKGYQVEQFLK